MQKYMYVYHFEIDLTSSYNVLVFLIYLVLLQCLHEKLVEIETAAENDFIRPLIDNNLQGLYAFSKFHGDLRTIL
jgi:hypothetical protein